MTDKYINPLTDTGFKLIFGTPEHKLLLIDFLNCLLKGERVIEDIEYRDKEQINDVKDGREIIFDIFCKTNTGEYVIVEMQKQRQINFVERTIYYASRAIYRQGKKGPWNYDIKAVYCVAFMNFKNELFGDKLCTSARLSIDGNGKQLSPVLRFFYIQLPLAKEDNSNYVTSLESWTYILNNNMEALRQPRYSENKVFDYLKEVTDVASLSLEDREKYERDLNRYWDACALDETYDIIVKRAENAEKKLKEAEEVNRKAEEAKRKAEEEKLGSAKKLKELGVPCDIISQGTGLPVEEIEKL